jgi:myo-inositol-1(or 4)-monophosphatase
MNINREKIQQLVREVAREELLPRFNTVKRVYKNDGSIVTEADHIVQHRLIETFQEICPNTLLLGEEMDADYQQQLLDSGQALWCLDPVDGTSNFAAGMPYFSVSLALIVNAEIVFGLVYDPVHDESFSAIKGEGAWLNDEPISLAEDDTTLQDAIALIDYKRLTEQQVHTLIYDKPFRSQRSLGSVALELCWLAAGRCQLYLHGKQQLWDYAAALLILNEAGGQTSTIHGEPVFNGYLGSRSTIAATNPSLFNDWKQALTTKQAFK